MYQLLISHEQKTTMKRRRTTLLYPAWALAMFLSFLSGYALGNSQIQSVPPDQQEEWKGSLPETTSRNSITVPESTKDIVIVFTVDEGNRIHVLDISGGKNPVTDYIKRSLEGRVIGSPGAVPGINYVMTLRFPSSV
ncbi:MAG: hypothetical protein H6547_02930 [Chitinophagales bacterium]|nr:hypothetical protein [Chitinophagales bacterium]HAE14488.1 hypothetical protein [Bacteroidota bacterium]HAE35994.1 hypothetical protein [Bacteroidota bacterium]